MNKDGSNLSQPHFCNYFRRFIMSDGRESCTCLNVCEQVGVVMKNKSGLLPSLVDLGPVCVHGRWLSPFPCSPVNRVSVGDGPLPSLIAL